MTRTLKPYLDPPFLICALILAATATSMPVVVKAVGGYLEKEPVSLRNPLQTLDANGLGQYNVVAKQKITNHEVLESLGTEDYIQWIIEDTNVPPASPVRRLSLFITYYPKADRVPHVPEECYLGGGHQLLGTDNVVLNIETDDTTRRLDAKYLVFGSAGTGDWKRTSKVPVLYFFRVSGDYASDREEARWALQNIFKKYAYFSKIEIAFNQKRNVPAREEAVNACERLVRVILPKLEKYYWPR